MGHQLPVGGMLIHVDWCGFFWGGGARGQLSSVSEGMLPFSLSHGQGELDGFFCRWHDVLSDVSNNKYVDGQPPQRLFFAWILRRAESMVMEN